MQQQSGETDNHSTPPTPHPQCQPTLAPPLLAFPSHHLHSKQCLLYTHLDRDMVGATWGVLTECLRIRSTGEGWLVVIDINNNNKHFRISREAIWLTVTVSDPDLINNNNNKQRDHQQE